MKGMDMDYQVDYAVRRGSEWFNRTIITSAQSAREARRVAKSCGNQEFPLWSEFRYVRTAQYK